jgi:hypothetical protein
MVRHTGEYLIDIKGIAVASVLTVQSTGIEDAELYTSETKWLFRTQWCLAGPEYLQYPGY